MRRFHVFPLLLAVALSGCAGGLPQAVLSDPTPLPATQPIGVVTTATPLSVTTAESVAPTANGHATHDTGDGTPVPAALATVAANQQSAPRGTLAWRDQTLRNDAVQLSISGLSAPQAGARYTAALAGAGGEVGLGDLAFGGDTASVTYAAPDAANLLATYQRVSVARVDASGTSQVVLRGALPAAALRHIRAVLVSAAGTPGGVGYALGLRQEADVLLQHAQFLRDSYDAGDFALVRRHAEHILNILHGPDATDGNGDGITENPGDGFGLLPSSAAAGYIDATIDSATLAGAARDATEGIKLHAGHVQISGENTRQRATQIEGLATQVLAAQDLAATRVDVLALLALAEQTVHGVDANGDEQVAPIPGEGGVLTAYQHAQLMAVLPLSPVAEAVVAAAEPTALPQPSAVPTSVPAAVAQATAIPTAAPAAQPGGAAQNAVVVMSDFAFSAQELRIQAGTTVVWKNSGVKAHSATAVDGAFDTGLLAFDGAQSVTFATPGTFPYFCEIHGTPDGKSGMVGTVVVE